MRIIDFLKTKAVLSVAIVCATLLAFIATSPNSYAQTQRAIPQEPVVPAVQKMHPGDPFAPGNWNGFYIGAHVGGNSTNYDIRSFDERVDVVEQFYQELGGPEGIVETGFSNFSLPRDNGNSDTRPTGGFQMGYNKQFGHFVVGLESNISFTSADETGRAMDFAEKFFTVEFTNDHNLL